MERDIDVLASSIESLVLPNIIGINMSTNIENFEATISPRSRPPRSVSSGAQEHGRSSKAYYAPHGLAAKRGLILSPIKTGDGTGELAMTRTASPTDQILSPCSRLLRRSKTRQNS